MAEEEAGGSKYDFAPKKRNFELEIDSSRTESLELDEVESHPLREGIQAGEEEPEVEEKVTISAKIDPLAKTFEDPLAGGSNDLPAQSASSNSSMATSIGQMGVLSSISQAKQAGFHGGYEVKTDEVRGALMFRNFEWDAKKASILEKYTVKDQIQVSFMQETTESKAEKEDTLENRLDELDLNETNTKDQKAYSLSQKEYIKHIENLHADLVAAWEADQRVKSLKIAIQMAKLLGDTSVPSFYPSKFVVVTEILDTFGKLVFERIRQRAKAFVGLENAGANAVHAEKSTSKNISFKEATATSVTVFGELDEAIKEFFVIHDIAQVPPQAKETCRNWFYKIASIRELLPRLYVEMSIMRCYQFLTNENYGGIISRLCAMARGISDPLVQAYCIAYLCRKGREMAPDQDDFLVRASGDLMTSFRLLNTTQTRLRDVYIKKHKLEIPVWMDLFSPALDWLIQCLTPLQTPQSFSNLLRKYEEHQEALVLHHLIEKCKPRFVSAEVFPILQLIHKAKVESYPRFLLLSELGDVCMRAPPAEEQRLVLLNDVWAEVRKLQDTPLEYLTVANSWFEFAMKFDSAEEVGVLLADIVGMIKQHEVELESEKLQELLHSIIQHLLAAYDFITLCTLEPFLPLLDRLKGDSQVEVNKAILKNFSRLTTTINDQLIINIMFSVGKVVHDSITSLSSAEQRAEVTDLCIAFIRGVEYGRDVEKHLNFFVECRRAFSNLDGVKRVLVLGVLRLIMKTHSIINGQHNKKTAAFVRACVAYCYITIPMIDSSLERLSLYGLAAQLAVLNQSLHQAEAMVEGAINLIADMPRHEVIEGGQTTDTQAPLLGFCKSLIGALVAIPGHPDRGAFYLLRMLLETVKEYSWDEGSLAMFEIRLTAICHLSAVAQDNIHPNYQIPNIDTNTVLYDGDIEYQNEIRLFIDQLLGELMNDMASWKEKNENQKAAEGALRLFNVLVSLAQLNSTSAPLAGNLCVLAKKFIDGGEESLAPFLKNSLEDLKESEDRFCLGIYKKLTGS